VHVCVSVTEEEISNMRRELDKYGIQMPAFSKIGGMLANEVIDSIHSTSLSVRLSVSNHCVYHMSSSFISFIFHCAAEVLV